MKKFNSITALTTKVLATLVATAALTTTGHAGTYTVDFRQDLNPARVSVNGFQQTKTAAGLRVQTATGGYCTVGFSLADLTTNTTSLEGDFTATLSYSAMTGFKNPGYEQLNQLTMRAPWGSFAGEDYIIERTFPHDWVSELFPWTADNYQAARRVSDNGTREFLVRNGEVFVDSGTMMMERIGNQMSFYYNGNLLGAGTVDNSRNVGCFYLLVGSTGSSTLDVTFNSFTLSGTNVAVVPEPASLSVLALGGMSLLIYRRKA